MMNLDEAIQHCKEKAKEQRSKAIGYFNGGYSSQIEGKSCLNCAEEHEQLAEWLTELKNMKDCIKTECFKCAKDKATIDNAPTVEVPENEVNCVLTMFGKCSYNETGCSDCEIKDKIRKALNERPQGEWIKVTKAGTVPVEYICSLCRRKIYDNYELTTPIDEFYPFCHCGADMRKGGAV